MNFILLTQQGGILGPFASILGAILDLIYKFFSLFGIESIALCIIVFTIVVRLLLFPMQLKQQKFAKVNSVMTPEIQKIQKKYEKKKDQQSQLTMQQEITEVYDKYGASPTGSCLQLLIQMPILFALYRVIYNIPAYVGQVREYYETIIANLTESQISKYFNISGMSGEQVLNNKEISNKIIDAMSGYRMGEIKDFNLTSMVETLNVAEINDAYEKIRNINNFFVYNLSDTPKEMWSTIGWLAIIIPVLAGLFQFISVQVSTIMNSSNTSKEMEDNPMMASMKTMNYVMPIMSILFCWTFATGIGLYWVAGSVVMLIQQVILYFYFKRISVDDIIEKNKAKAKKKKEKRGFYENMISQAAAENTKSNSKTSNNNDSVSREELYNAAMEKYKSKSSDKNSISSRANMVRDFNNKNK